MDRSDAIRLMVVNGVRMTNREWDEYEESAWIAWSTERASFVDECGDPCSPHELPRRRWRRYEP